MFTLIEFTVYMTAYTPVILNVIYDIMCKVLRDIIIYVCTNKPGFQN